MIMVNHYVWGFFVCVCGYIDYFKMPYGLYNIRIAI